MTPFFDQLTDPKVRALAWSCFSPPLIQSLVLKDGRPVAVPEFKLTDHRRQWLLELDSDPEPLHRHLADHCTSSRLGLVFEALWHFFLEQDQHTELLLHNLPVRDHKRTLGEFDIIYRSLPSDEVFHLELAVKFYLAGPSPRVPGNPLSQWLGPNVQDRLDLKLQRLQEHQLLLAERHSARDALRRQGIERLSPQLLIKGWLFQPWLEDYALPEMVNPDYTRGRWMPVSRFSKEIQSRYKHWYWLEKPQWLDGHQGGHTLTEKCLRLARNRPQMLLACQEKNREALRLFITPDNWPEL